MPISLSYHAGGIRVTDRTYTTGLGWSLIAGGAITRAIAGLPDEESRGFFNMNYPDDLSEACSGFNFQRDDGNIELNKISCFVNRVNNTGANHGYNEDYSPDNYYYNVQGLSGQFSYSADKTLHTYPYDPISIQRSLLAGKTPFTITASDGVTYEFGKPVENGKNPATDYIKVGDSPDYASAWYLTKIISVDKSDTVTFLYSTDADSYRNTSLITTMHAGFAGFATGIVVRPARIIQTPSSTMEYNVRLLDIIGKNGRVHFNYGEETVYSYNWENGFKGDPIPSTIRPLSSIEVYANTGSEVKIKQFNFQHSFFNSDPVHAPNSLRLDKVTEVGFLEGSSQAPPYIFSYATDDVPPFNTNSRDLWGYYNAYTSPRKDNDNMLLVDLPDPGSNTEPVNAFKKREVNPSVLNMGMLKSISYPTGGYTEFTFEPNNKSKIVDVDEPQNNNCLIRTAMGDIDRTFQPNSKGYNRSFEFIGKLVTCCNPFLENLPKVILKDMTTNTVVIEKELIELEARVKTEVRCLIPLPQLYPDHIYRLYFPMPSIKTNDQTYRYDLFAYLQEQTPSSTSTQEKLIYTGGLRIKSIEHKDNVTSGVIKKKYNYTESYWNSDAFTGDFNSINTAFGKQLYVQDVAALAAFPNYYQNDPNARMPEKAASYIYMESPTYSIGSPSSSVSYSKVEEIQVTADDKPLGKTEYIFNTGMDIVPHGVGNDINWRQQVKIDRSFIRSQLLNKKIYKSEENDWVLIQETKNFYSNINDLPFYTKGTEYIKKYVTAYLYDDEQFYGWAGRSLYEDILPEDEDHLCPAYLAFTPISFNSLYINIVKPALDSTIIREVGASGNWIVNKTSYKYMNLSHMKPGEIVTSKSDGSTL
ncbi:MAG TPA: hypothetical protein VHO90_17760, partial [Bacteroidales bacterium]|nr:hypothetical protein [Bacteroidales bacterium]